MEIATMENSVKIEQAEGDFQVHAQLTEEQLGNIDDLKALINQSLSRHDIHACMFRFGNVVIFASSSYGAWSEKKAQIVFDKVVECLPVYELNIKLTKRKRQVRDALNKCTDPTLIEEIGRLLRV